MRKKMPVKNVTTPVKKKTTIKMKCVKKPTAEERLTSRRKKLKSEFILYQSVRKFIEKNNKEYLIIATGYSGLLVAKLKNFKVKKTINPMGFTPVEQEIDKRELVLCMVYYSDDKEISLVFGLDRFGCRKVMVRNEDEIERVMESI